MVTARSDEIDRLLGLETGADDFIVQAVQPARSSRPGSTRCSAVRGRASWPNGDAPELLVYGGLRVDLDARRVYREGEKMLLTRTEFDLLTELMRSPTKVATREDLLGRLGHPLDRRHARRRGPCSATCAASSGAPELHPHRARCRLPDGRAKVSQS